MTGKCLLNKPQYVLFSRHFYGQSPQYSLYSPYKKRKANIEASRGIRDVRYKEPPIQSGGSLNNIQWK